MLENDINIYWVEQSNAWLLDLWTVDQVWINHGAYSSQEQAEKEAARLLCTYKHMNNKDN